jgi:hypothetical protein
MTGRHCESEWEGRWLGLDGRTGMSTTSWISATRSSGSLDFASTVSTGSWETRPRERDAARLPIDAFWPILRLVVEFHERQHSEAVPFFDKPDRMTVSGVTRGEQRARYYERRRQQVPAHGLRLVLITLEDFTHRRARIVRNVSQDRATVARCLQA